LINFRCIDESCFRSKESTRCTRKQFLFGHVAKKQNEKIIEILWLYDLIKFPNLLSTYSIVNIFADFCTEPVASKILEMPDTRQEQVNNRKLFGEF
jgi:hypothetical protein